jgi:hypothetical protein
MHLCQPRRGVLLHRVGLACLAPDLERLFMFTDTIRAPRGPVGSVRESAARASRERQHRGPKGRWQCSPSTDHGREFRILPNEMDKQNAKTPLVVICNFAGSCCSHVLTCNIQPRRSTGSSTATWPSFAPLLGKRPTISRAMR